MSYGLSEGLFVALGQMPSGLSMVNNGMNTAPKDVPIAMKYLMGLQSRASNGYRTVRDSIGGRLSLSARPSGMSNTGPNSSFMGSSQIINVDALLPGENSASGSVASARGLAGISIAKMSSWWDGDDSAAGEIGTMPEMAKCDSEPDLLGLGQSFFCNVMHLRRHGFQSPLAYVTYNVLHRSGLIQVRLRMASVLRALSK
jgi:hypothetical protein